MVKQLNILMAEHPTVDLNDPDGYVVAVDEEIADLISILWDNNYKTSNSCQDNYTLSMNTQRKEHFVWIEFVTPDYASRFIKEYIGRDLELYYEVVDTWDLHTSVANTNTKYYPSEDVMEDRLPLKLSFEVSVRFPREQLERVEARLREIYE